MKQTFVVRVSGQTIHVLMNVVKLLPSTHPSICDKMKRIILTSDEKVQVIKQPASTSLLLRDHKVNLFKVPVLDTSHPPPHLTHSPLLLHL